MPTIDILRLIEEIDVSTREAIAYAIYFDFLRQQGKKEKWDKFTIRAFILSVSEIKKGYYSVLRKVKDEVLFRDISEMEKMQWLKGWIFYKNKSGVWHVVVDGESDEFDEFKRIYKELREQ